MATNYPSSLDTSTELPVESDNTTLSTNHVTAHQNIQDAIEAIEAKVGVDSSAVTSSLDYKVTNTSSSNPGHKHTLANGATDVTASAAELNVLDGIPVTLTATEIGYVDGVTSSIQTQLDGKVNDTGNETIDGVKTFTSDPIIPDEVYSSSWNGVLEPPTKNAVYDKIETIVNTYKNGVTTRAGDTASGDQTIAHGLGATPKYIRITVTKTNSTNGGVVFSSGVYNGTTNSCVYSVGYDTGNGNTNGESGNSATQIAYVKQIQPGATGTQVAVATFDSTNITLTWTKSGTVNASNMNILWEAQSGT